MSLKIVDHPPTTVAEYDAHGELMDKMSEAHLNTVVEIFNMRGANVQHVTCLVCNSTADRQEINISITARFCYCAKKEKTIPYTGELTIRFIPMTATVLSVHSTLPAPPALNTERPHDPTTTPHDQMQPRCRFVHGLGGNPPADPRRYAAQARRRNPRRLHRDSGADGGHESRPARIRGARQPVQDLQR